MEKGTRNGTFITQIVSCKISNCKNADSGSVEQWSLVQLEPTVLPVVVCTHSFPVPWGIITLHYYFTFSWSGVDNLAKPFVYHCKTLVYNPYARLNTSFGEYNVITNRSGGQTYKNKIKARSLKPGMLGHFLCALHKWTKTTFGLDSSHVQTSVKLKTNKSQMSEVWNWTLWMLAPWHLNHAHVRTYVCRRSHICTQTHGNMHVCMDTDASPCREESDDRGRRI